MSHWGKIIGACFGYLIGGVFGTIIGLLSGHLVDKSIQSKQPPKFTKVSSEQLERIKSEFFTATFSVMGYIARSSGLFGNQENFQASKVMNRMGLPVSRRVEALRLFEDGKMPNFSLQDMVGQFYVACRDQPNLLEMFIEIQLYAALATGRLQTTEKKIILNICYQLDLAHTDYDRLEHLIKAEFRSTGNGNKSRARKARNKAVGANLEDAYAILNTSPNASNDDVKKAYRRLTSRHHPDKLVARGLPDEMMKIAENKTSEIRAAYDRIREARSLSSLG